MTVAVLTDTAAALSPELASQWGVGLVPLTIVAGGRAYRDTDVDLPTLLSGSGRITTSGPPPSEFLRALASMGAGVEGAVIVTVAEALSSTHAAAVIAAGATGATGPPVLVVDSGTAAGGQGLVALAAAERARSGAGLDEVAAAARAAVPQVRLVGCLPTLDGLVRSGRMPGLAAAAARRAGLQFMFELRAGAIRPLRPAASFGAAAGRMVARCAADSGAGVDVLVLGPPGAQAVHELTERIRRAAEAGTLRLRRMWVGTFGTAILAYTGPEVAGLSWRRG
ncbi:MAG TPA: DegV family protein [Actinomycetes bacterium]|jgi:DegV family protein with EDD domain|nr:DegV family protein [Actinomycetes bacterium]